MPSHRDWETGRSFLITFYRMAFGSLRKTVLGRRRFIHISGTEEGLTHFIVNVLRKEGQMLVGQIESPFGTP